MSQHSPQSPPRKLTICVERSCEGCPVVDGIECGFQRRDLVAFLSIVYPALVVGGIGLYRVGGWWLTPWLLFCLGYFFVAENWALCSHCARYSEPGSVVRCWANYGIPRLFKHRPGPMSPLDRVVFVGGLALMFAFPAGFIVAGAEWTLLVIYVLTIVAFAVPLSTFYCTRCVNIACPFNRVDDATREEFLSRNPIMAAAWHPTPAGRPQAPTGTHSPRRE